MQYSGVILNLYVHVHIHNMYVSESVEGYGNRCETYTHIHGAKYVVLREKWDGGVTFTIDV